jgi:hypothetical protein
VDIEQEARLNMKALAENVYPGRGIVIGLTPDARCYAQVYWIMGRSENSRNRIFVEEGDTVRTAPFDESKVEDPSLIIYNCARSMGRRHIVSNGDQTDTIFEALRGGGTFEEALATRTFEPDAPNYTPRVSGLVDLDDACAYRLSVIKSVAHSPDHCTRHFFAYETAVPGVGHCIHTYAGDGAPLPPFRGEPYPVELANGLHALADLYWEALNEENRISLLARLIDTETGAARTRIVNKHAG